ncbi:MAG: hypothetical protein JNM27_01325 [Leptospirales bacterium]|nr:hypothetical protein [Leptospirales bacterium]
MRLTGILAAAFLLFVQCAALPIQSPSGKERVVLAAQESKCAPENSYRQWAWMFGAFPINKPQLAFANPSKSYRITEHSGYADIAIDVLLGSFTTVTRRTITVNVCEETFSLASPEQQAALREKETATAIDQYLTEPSGITQEPIFIMLNGETRRGNILEVSDAQLKIMERKKADQIEITETDREKRVAKVLLRDGTTVVGEVLDQSPVSMTVKTDRGTVTIVKAKVRRISYTTVADIKKEAKETRKEVLEPATLERKEIQRIILASEVSK